ncbi:MAG TPA: hypothetical protein PLQ13_03725 [Candidatus Krumholzibacteria bacterium]|nr:hypothetical protein [Candidatus Krumholzibacteria bacterium]
MMTLRSRTITFAVLAALLMVAFAGCSNDDTTPTTPVSQAPQDNSPDLRATMSIQERYTPALMASPDVIGTATTLGEDGRPAVLLLVTSDKAVTQMPSNLDGVPVQVLLTDRIVAMRGAPGGGGGGGGGVSHTAKQSTPIQLGTSGGWSYDLANGYCCGGTLGSLIQVGGQKRILSNYHVFEADIVNGGNGRRSQTGDPVIQPGLIDINCSASAAQTVATLVVSGSLPGSNVDASTANIVSGMVDPNGAILEIGTLSAQTVAAFVNQPVKKSGRTTGLTRSKVSGLNATISVAYENECAGGSAFTKTYTGQIVIANKASKFLAGGDSGSLMVEDVTSNPRAVGLLFAGSSTTAIANPINEVLNFFNATMVGN